MSEHQDGNDDLKAAAKVITDTGIYAMGSPDPIDFTQTFSAPSGCDIKVFLGDQLLDTLQAISVSQENPIKGGQPIVGQMIFILLTNSILKSLPEKFDLKLRSNTEFGHAMVSYLRGVRITNYGLGMSVDDSILEEQLTYEADSYEPFAEVKRAL